MSPSARSSNLREVWRAGDLRIDVGTGTVRRDDALLDISGLTFDLLVALVRAAPNYLSHDELLTQVWNGRIVSSATIMQRVLLLRRALDDTAAESQYVGLVKGRGYRFLASVQSDEDEALRPGVVVRYG